MARVAAGDRQALAELYASYARLIYSFAVKVAGDSALAEDVVQDVFLRIWRGAGQFDPQRGRLASWMLQITRNRALDLLRSRSRARPAGGAEDVTLHDPQREEDPSEEMATAVHVREALAGLSPEQRQAIDLAFFHGLTHQQIAERTGIPLGTIKSRLRLALVNLRRQLEAGASEEVKRRG